MNADTLDPIEFIHEFWPQIKLHRKQIEIVLSVRDNDETIVPAANMVGKDFVAALVVLWYFLAHETVKIVTTSATSEHLDILWGEIDQFVRTSEHGLTVERDGLLMCGRQFLAKIVAGVPHRNSYACARVASSTSRGEGLSGHHSPHTLWVCDEGSGVPDIAYKMAQGWAKRMLIFGNPHPCCNFFFHGVESGDVKAEDNGHYHRRVIRIRAEDSPDVKRGLKFTREGKPIPDEPILPGVLTYAEYRRRRLLWDQVQQTVGLDAQFPKDASLMLCPPEWLSRAAQIGAGLEGQRRRAVAMGVDSAMGGDKTAWCVVDQLGVIALISVKTPDTTVITSRTLALMREHNLSADAVLFDAGGGGKVHADRLRLQGHPVRTVNFGESAKPIRHHGLVTLETHEQQDATRYAYRHRRDEMYGTLRGLLDPSNNSKGFGIASRFEALHDQLVKIPLRYDEEGRLRLPPKQARADVSSSRETLIGLIGHSPDEADALAMAVWRAFGKPVRPRAGALLL